MRIPITLHGEVVGQAKISLSEKRVYNDIELTSEQRFALLKANLTGVNAVEVSYSLDDQKIHIVDPTKEETDG